MNNSLSSDNQYEQALHDLGATAIENNEQALYLAALLSKAVHMLAMQEESFIAAVLATFVHALDVQTADYQAFKASRRQLN